MMISVSLISHRHRQTRLIATNPKTTPHNIKHFPPKRNLRNRLLPDGLSPLEITESITKYLKHLTIS